MFFRLYILSSNGPEVHAVNVYKDNKNKDGYVKLGNTNVPLNILEGLYLRDYVCSIKGVGDSDKNNLKLWKVTGVKIKDIKKQNISTEQDIVQKLDGREMELEEPFSTYFQVELDNKISGSSIITIIPTIATGQKRFADPESIEPRKRLRSVINLDDLKELIADIERNVTIDSPPELYPESTKDIAGRFSKKGSFIPISGNKFPDMRLDQFVTPIGERLVSIFKNKEKDFQMIYGVSGAGKTRAIFDMTLNDELFVTYIECRASPVEEERPFLEPTADTNYATLYDRIDDIFKEFPIEDAIMEAERFIALEFVARVLYLILLNRKMDGNLTPREYLLAQINGGQACIKYIVIYLSSFDFSIAQMESIFKIALGRYLKEIKLIFAIDEANIAATQHFVGKFKSIRDKPRGLLTPMVMFLNENQASMIIAGTSFSLEHGRGVIGDIGKGGPAEYLDLFQTLTIKDVESYLEKYIDLSGCNLKEIEGVQFLAGRPRFASRLVLEIIRAEECVERNQENKPKQEVLKEAIERTIKVVSNRLISTLDYFIKDAYNGIDENGWKDIMDELFVNCWFFGGYISSFEITDRSRKLIDSGIARLAKNNEKSLVIDERLAVNVVKTVLLPRYTRPDEALLLKLTTELKRNATKISDTSKGATWQYLAQAGLMNYNNYSVAEFVYAIYKDEVFKIGGKEKARLPEWTKEAIININSYGALDKLSWQIRDKFQHKKLNDEVDFISMLLENRKDRVYMLDPSITICPDGVYIGNAISASVVSYWTLLISTKIYGSPLSGNDDINNDKRTTDWRYLYYENSESRVDKKSHQIKKNIIRRKLDEVCDKFKHQGSLRIHFILPGLAKSRDKSDRGGCRVEGNDVIMYIDQNLLNIYFQNSQYTTNVIENILE